MDREERKKLKHDEFVEQSINIFHYLENHPKPFLFGAGAIVVGVLAVWTVMGLSQSWAGKSAELLSQGAAALNAPVVAEAAKPNDMFRPTFSSEQERDRQAATRLAEAAKASGTPGAMAEYLRGVALLRAGDAPGAVSTLESASKRLGTDRTLGTSVTAALAEAYSVAGQADKSAGLWRDLSKADSGFPRDIALVGLGRALEKAGKRDEAKAAYKQVETDFQGSSVSASAKAGLARLGA